MGFCLDCHRNSEDHLRPLDKITDLDWEASEADVEKFFAKVAEEDKTTVDALKEKFKGEWTPELLGKHLKKRWAVNPPQDCTACHR